MDAEDKSMLRSISTKSVRDARSELSIVISRMQSSGNRNDRNIGVNAAMMLRRAQSPSDIATAMLYPPRDWKADISNGPSVRRVFHRRTEVNLPPRHSSRRFGKGRKFVEVVRHDGKAEATATARRFRHIRGVRSGGVVGPKGRPLLVPVVVNARVVKKGGGYSVYVRAREASTGPPPEGEISQRMLRNPLDSPPRLWGERVWWGSADGISALERVRAAERRRNRGGG